MPRILSEDHDRSGNQDQKEAADGETEDDSDHDNRDQRNSLSLLSGHTATVLPAGLQCFTADLMARADIVAIASRSDVRRRRPSPPKRRRSDGTGLAQSRHRNLQR